MEPSTSQTNDSLPLLRADSVSKHFMVRGSGSFGRNKPLQAVRQVSFDMQQGEVIAVVGESGSGKSTLGRLVLGLIDITEGSIFFEGTEVSRLRGAALKWYRRQAQMIFQNPVGSFNPRKTVRASLRLPYIAHRLCSTAEADRRAAVLLERVGLQPAERYLDAYPHQLSGGQCQRVAIARALAFDPKLIVADEPLSALDMSVRTQVLEVLQSVRREHHLAMIFITHDLTVVRAIADSIIVMYLGQVVEAGPTEAVLEQARHPYTRSLLAATPRIPLDGRRVDSTRMPLRGEIPSPLSPPSGCSFRTRCPHNRPGVCDTEEPHLRSIDRTQARCHFAEEIALSTTLEGGSNR